MIVGVPVESDAEEKRVALTPEGVRHLVGGGHRVVVQAGAGASVGHDDAAYQDAGADVSGDRDEVFGSSELICQVNTFAADGGDHADLARYRASQVVIGLANPLGARDRVAAMAARGITGFGLELVPRITRAQRMDVLSSMAMIAGYRAAVLGAERLPRCLPMFMTAAGTVQPARVFVIGAGVAGLQACATAKRLGARVSAYDVRPQVKEQVESVGASFVELELDTSKSQDAGGYAREQTEATLELQRQLMLAKVAESDIVITTAAIPGKAAPRLVTRQMVEAMTPGSVLIDLAARGGGNCELTQAGREVDHGGVKILGPLHITSEVAHHASQLYSRNMIAFVDHVFHPSQGDLDLEDEIVRGTLLCRGGDIVHERLATRLEKKAC
jgi:NAD(P) transhydrogenase subunit alpha